MAIKKVNGITIVEGEYIRNVSVKTGQALFADRSIPGRVQNAAQFCTRMVHEFLNSQGYKYGIIYVTVTGYQGLDDFELSVLYRPRDIESPLCAGYFKTTTPGLEGILHGTLGVALYPDRTPPRERRDNGHQYKRWDCTVDIGALIY